MWTFSLFPLVIALSMINTAVHSQVPWGTLHGKKPLVIAEGGFSGLFPHSSSAAYSWALQTSVPDVVLSCNVELTKDGVGVCLPTLKLQNATNIAFVYPSQYRGYNVNGKPMNGWFPLDYTYTDLRSLFVNQAVHYRTAIYNADFHILTAENLAQLWQPPALWLNFQYPTFYGTQNLSMRSYILSVSKRITVDYISSPEVHFLRGIKPAFSLTNTKIIFRFMGKTDLEPTTKLTYGLLLKNLTFVRTFASGILVPKKYIWPIDADKYLQPHTSIVTDAHNEGLEVFCSDFANDVLYSYNFSYDPVAEYLQFIDNGEFAVDGVLSDFPITASSAIDCFSGRDGPNQVPIKIISKNGASGDYPGCTDLAYVQAMLDGVDYLDCPVQMTNDGVVFCFPTIDLSTGTNAADSNYTNYGTVIPDVMPTEGIFPFNLTWADIKTLSPTIFSPYKGYELLRNPKIQNPGRFLTLAEFLDLAKETTKATNLSGVIIGIENAAYLAKQGLGVTDAVLKVLKDADYQKASIQSTDSSVLVKFKKVGYETIYQIKESITDATKASIEDVKTFADAVVIQKASVIPLSKTFTLPATEVVSKIKYFKLPVYVEVFSNEYDSQAWDFYSDVTVEIDTFVSLYGIDGVITDYPKTADRYRKNRCLDKKLMQRPPYMRPIAPGSILHHLQNAPLPPASAPINILTESEVVESPLPPVSPKPATLATPATPPENGTAQPTLSTSVLLSSLAAVFFTSLLLL